MHGNGIGENIMPFEENEISQNSQGGTESVKRELAKRLPEGLADDFQIICSRVRKLEEDKIRVYWLHDLPEDPETSHLQDVNSRNKFHKLVFCGNWQYNRYQLVLGVPYDTKSIVIDTPIDPAPVVKKEYDKIRLIYTSTPQRGLELLVPVFEALAKKYDNIHLDVFSSFKIYGWEQADDRYKELYKKIEDHPQMTYHGYQPNEIVKEYLLKAHIHAYPSIWLECNSRSVIEAMSAGLICVHPNYGGLSDTSGNLNFTYQGDTDHNTHANIFYGALDHAISVVDKEEVQNYIRFVKAYADTRFSWNRIVTNWTDVLTDLKQRYPTIESRKIKSEVIEYNTL